MSLFSCSTAPHWLLTPVLAGSLLLSSCNTQPASTETAATTASTDSTGTADAVQLTGAKPAWGPAIKPEMQAVIE